eukprot:9063039-Prorocentrum_lima.AAC.1
MAEPARGGRRWVCLVLGMRAIGWWSVMVHGAGGTRRASASVRTGGGCGAMYCRSTRSGCSKSGQVLRAGIAWQRRRRR